jgi:hypothetical protein
MGATAAAAVGISVANFSSPAALWAMAHQIQLLLLLLLTKRYFPDDVKAVLQGNSFMSFDFSFIPVTKAPGVKQIMDFINIDQDNVYLETIGLESGSGVKNLISVVSVFLLCVVLHLSIVFAPKIKIVSDDQIWKIRYNTLNTHLYNLFTFTMYVRVLFEGYQFLFLASFSELKNANVSEVYTALSFSISCLFTVICIVFLLLTLYMYCSTKDNFNKDERLKFGELFSGLKETNNARSYSFFVLLRRVLFVSLLVGLNTFASFWLVAGMAVIQTFYLAYIVALRPFDKVSNNIIEVVNEVFYWILIVLLFHLNKEIKWTDFASRAYLGIIVGNTMIIGLVVSSKCLNLIFIAEGIWKLAKWLKSKCSKEIQPRAPQYVSFLI